MIIISFRAYQNMIKSMQEGYMDEKNTMNNNNSSSNNSNKSSNNNNNSSTNNNSSSNYNNFKSAYKKNNNKSSSYSYKNQQDYQQQQISQHDFTQFQKAFNSFIRKGKIDPRHRVYSRFFAQFFANPHTDNDVFSQRPAPDPNYSQQQHQPFFSSKDIKLITINARLNITKQQALQGITKNILYKKTIVCQMCLGHSTQNKKVKCKKCAGTGFFGKNIHDIGCCNVCNGSGFIKKHGCKECKGKGTMEIHCQQSVKVPKNSINNQQIILKGRGHQHPHKYYFGDVYIRLKINNKPLIKIDGINTYSSVKVSILSIILKQKIQYPTLKGNKQIQIQMNKDRQLDEDQEIIIKGEGMKKGNKVGDHYLKIKVQIPKILTKRQQEIYKRLKDIEDSKKKQRSQEFQEL